MSRRTPAEKAAEEAQKARRDERHRALCYLSHLSAVAMGEGREVVVRTASGLVERRGRIVRREKVQTAEPYANVVARGGSNVELTLDDGGDPIGVEDVHSIELDG